MITAQQWAEAKMHEALKTEAPRIALAGMEVGKLLRSYYSIFTRNGMDLVEFSPSYDALKASSGYLRMDKVDLVVVHGRLPRNECDTTDCIRKVPGLLRDIELDCESVFVIDRDISHDERRSIVSFGYAAVIGSVNRNEVAGEIQAFLQAYGLIEQPQAAPADSPQTAEKRFQVAA